MIAPLIRGELLMAKVTVRKGMPSIALDKAEFKRRFMDRFFDPAFAPLKREIEKVADAAWDGYDKYRKAPVTMKAGKDFADPNYDLSVQWHATHKAINAAEKRQKDPKSRARILIVNGSSRSDQSCPGEMSKTWRL